MIYLKRTVKIVFVNHFNQTGIVRVVLNLAITKLYQKGKNSYKKINKATTLYKEK